MLCPQFFNGALEPPDSLLALRSKTSENGLTISLLISWDIDCSGSIRCGAWRFPPTAGYPRAYFNPVCAVGPEAPWRMADMSCLEMIGRDLQGGRKVTARKSRGCGVLV